MNQRLASLLAALLIAAVGAPKSWAQGVNLATGLDSAGNLITTGGVNDANWTVTPDPVFSPTGIPQTVFPGDGDSGFPSWIANGPNSDWISRSAANSDNGPAPYTFTRTFNLTASQIATASISGAWTIDDTGTLALNGNTLATLPVGSWGSLWSFNVPVGSPDFVVGTNSLTMTITDNDRFLEGARLEGFLIPEPSSLVMGATALLIVGAGLFWRRGWSS
jgi:hypothetical protein